MLSIKKSIPTEIINLLEEGGHSLQIKGPAGTGKTTLALVIAKDISSKGNAIYLSTRVSSEQILTQFPWVRDFLEEQNILDAKRCYITSYIRRSGREYTDQPEFLKTINEKIQTSKRRPVTIIIDSLEALKTNLNISKAESTLETILLELGEKTVTNMLFVSEISGENILDYLVDGLVKLEREIINGRLVRKMYLEKMRAQSNRYVFLILGMWKCSAQLP